MKDFYADEIKKINYDAEKYAREKNFNRNYIHLFRPNINKQLNIVGSFKEAIKKEQGRASSFTVNSKKSFGMVAKKDFSSLKKIFLSDEFSNCEKFASYNKNKSNHFCIDIDEYKLRKRYNCYTFDQYQNAFHARCVIASSWLFAFHIIQVKSLELLLELENDPHIIFEKKKNSEYFVYGRIDEAIIKKYAEQDIEISSGNGNIKRLRLADLYSQENEEFFECENMALYSGVIPRLCQVIYKKPEFGNKDIHKLLLQLGRTSYMTMFAFNFRNDDRENERLLNHPFFGVKEEGKSLREILYYFDQCEVKEQAVFYAKMKNAKNFSEELNALNEYLTSSWNIHNINISANLITTDDECIYVRRSQQVVDSNLLYCSVNGGSEIDDVNVKYYRNSVQEDIPSIQYSKRPVFFGGEMNREAIAELGVSDSSSYWKYYGFTCMTKYQGENSKHALWLHFNILGERYCGETFEQIENNRLTASEKFENVDVYGYALSVKCKKKDVLWSVIYKLFSGLMDWKDLISLILILSIIGWSEIREKENQISTLFCVVFLIFVVLRTIEKINKKKRIKDITIRVYKTNDWQGICKKIFKGNDEIDLILYILTRMRTLSLVQRKE